MAFIQLMSEQDLNPKNKGGNTSKARKGPNFLPPRKQNKDEK